MSVEPAESLADAVADGTYVPSAVDQCTNDLPLDRSPQVVRVQQFILFADPGANIRSPAEPAYLIFQQYEQGSGRPNRPDLIDHVVKPFAGVLTAAVGRGGRSTAQPSPTAPSRAEDAASGRRAAAAATGAASTAVAHVVEPLRRAGFSPGSRPDRGALGDILAGVLTPVVLPDPYQPFRNPHPHVALLATFEQVWEPKGYTRGELINTIGLAPGEQLTLEFHSWDKTTYKSQDELVQESELRVSQTATQRDALTVARESTSQTGGRLNAGATIPIKAASVTLGGDVSQQITRSTKQTADHTQQRSVDASNSLKTTRKLNIEISRDAGRELKQTRTISNTNRCHPLSFHYFEVLANYLVTVRLASLEPCLLLPMPRAGVTPAWVLCHEAVLKRALLDNAYLPGFDGARTLANQNAYVEIRKIRGTVPKPFEAELKLLLADVIDTFSQLSAIADLAGWPMWLNANGLEAAHTQGSLQQATYTAASASGYTWNGAEVGGLIVLRRLLYFVLLAANERQLHALRRLYKNRKVDPPSVPLRMFFASVSPHEYRLAVSATNIVKGLAALGLPTSLFDSLTSWNLADLVPDDAGLYDALSASAKRLDEIWSLPAEDGGTAPASPSDAISDMDLARARVDFEQLRCHIEDNWLHYAKSMWLDEDPDARFLRLQGYGAVAAVLGTDVLGFLGHKQGFAVIEPQAIKAIDFNGVISTVREQFDADPPAPRLLTLPTGGTILEAIVGECDGCEEYVHQSRAIDLRLQEAKAKQEEVEASRREMRLNAEPPDLSDPNATGSAKVIVNVDGQQPPSQ